MKSARFLQEAQQEFLGQVAHHNDRQQGLGDRILIFAVAHFKRKPSFWRLRRLGL